MSSSTAKKAFSLADYVDRIAFLAEEGLETVVIGGCAVGAYARLMGETVFSSDLDLYAEHRVVDDILDRVKRRGARLRKRPAPVRLVGRGRRRHEDE